MSGRFRWRQLGDAYWVEVWGPLGQGRTYLEGDAGHMTVRRGSGVLAQGRPGEVMRTHLGWYVPTSQLARWIQGEVGTAAQDVKKDDVGRVSSFTHEEWQVTLDRFADVEGGLDATSSAQLPGRIKATSETQRITVMITDRAG